MALIVGILAAPPATTAQEPTRIPRIGILRSGSPPDPFVDVFRHGLRELGYAEGRNIGLEYRWTEGPADLVRLKVDVIVASGPAPALAAKHATAEIPIVPIVSDPVGLGEMLILNGPSGSAIPILPDSSSTVDRPWISVMVRTDRSRMVTSAFPPRRTRASDLPPGRDAVLEKDVALQRCGTGCGNPARVAVTVPCNVLTTPALGAVAGAWPKTIAGHWVSKTITARTCRRSAADSPSAV